MANILVHWHPQSTTRILLCAHYDTLPFPLRDKENPQGPFVGANDNASGVAVLMELARDMPTLRTKYGIDFLLLDGEEFIFNEQDRFFLGSEYFAREYVKAKPPYRYRWGVLLDMVGDADLQIYQERNSMWWKDTRPLVEQIWATAARLGVREFVAKPKYEIERRPRDAALGWPHSLHRRDRLRLSPLAHPRRHLGQMLALEPGQGWLGDSRVAADGAVEKRGP